LPGTAGNFPVPRGSGKARLGWINTGSTASRLRVGWSGATSQQLLSAEGPGCSTLEVKAAKPAATASLLIELVSGSGALDFIDAEPRPPG
jgi:hypothetical protein